jgi:hypothetical protein
MLIISKYCEYDVSSIWAQLKPYLRRCCEVLPEVTRSEVTSVTWPELTPVTCRVRKYVLRMRNRKLHHIRPSVTFWPKVTSITWPEDMPCPEVALIESRLCACAAFSRVFFLLAVVTWLPDVTKGPLIPFGVPLGVRNRKLCNNRSSSEKCWLGCSLFFWYCEDLLIIPDLKYLYCDMNYLINPYMSKKSYFSKEPIFKLFKPPPQVPTSYL